MPSPDMVGWVDAPLRRGSINIIYGCLLVLFTAVWTVIHLNLPATGDGGWTIFLRKLRWVSMAILAPDLLTLYAAAQWESASSSVSQMHDLGHGDWSMEHAFYADSGGFFLQAPDIRPFPIKATSIHYLISRGYIEYPRITKDEIWDKSKSDKFAKGAALLQAGWLVVQSIARTSQGLALSPLELFTLAFVASTSMTYFFWLHKPQHVGTPTLLHIPHSTEALLLEAGDAATAPYRDTPLDFVEKPNQLWKRRQMFEHFDLPDRPLLRVPDDAIMPGKWTPRLLILVSGTTMIHSTILLLGWNLNYPTSTERLLWRVATSLSICSAAAVMVLSAFGVRSHNLVWIWVKTEQAGRGWKDAIVDAGFTFTTVCLVAARLSIIGEGCASFRLLPRDVFDVVEWTLFIPHW